MLCSRRCRECGGPIRFRGETMCRPCQKRATLAAAKSPCPRCGKPGYLREVDRVVWLVLPARPAKGSAPHLCELRRVAPPRRARHVWAMLAAPPGPAVRARRDTGRSAHRTAGLARRLRRVSGRPPLPRSRLRADHHAVSAARRRTPQPPAKRARAGPPTRPVDGVTGTCPGDVLHPARPGDGHRPGPSGSPPDGARSGSTAHQPGCVPLSRSSPSPCCALAIGLGVRAPGPAPTEPSSQRWRPCATSLASSIPNAASRIGHSWTSPILRRSSLSCRTTELDV